MHNHTHIHYHLSVVNMNKETVLKELETLSSFTGFDDFMYYSYKHWFFITQENLVAEAKKAFENICTKYNKFKTDNKETEVESFVIHMNKLLEIVSKHELHEATEEVENFVDKYVLKAKFLRNFNKRVAGGDLHHH